MRADNWGVHYCLSCGDLTRACSIREVPEELPQSMAAEQTQGQGKQRDKTPAEVRLVVLARQRLTLIAYLHDKTSDEDWHGVCDAANDLRELDCEARTLEDRR